MLLRYKALLRKSKRTHGLGPKQKKKKKKKKKKSHQQRQECPIRRSSHKCPRCDRVMTVSVSICLGSLGLGTGTHTHGRHSTHTQ